MSRPASHLWASYEEISLPIALHLPFRVLTPSIFASLREIFFGGLDSSPEINIPLNVMFESGVHVPPQDYTAEFSPGSRILPLPFRRSKPLLSLASHKNSLDRTNRSMRSPARRRTLFGWVCWIEPLGASCCRPPTETSHLSERRTSRQHQLPKLATLIHPERSSQKPPQESSSQNPPPRARCSPVGRPH